MAYSKGRLLTMAIAAKANEKGLTLKEAARESGIGEATATSWMKGMSEPSEKELKTICEHIGCSVKDIKNMLPQNLIAKEEKESEDASAKEVDNKKKESSDPVKEKPVKSVEPVKTEKISVEKKSSKTDSPKKEVKSDKSEDKQSEKVTIVKTEKPKEKEKPMEEVTVKTEQTNEEVVKPVNEEKKPKPTAKRQSSKKTLFSEDTETFIKKASGLKKSDAIDKKAVTEAVDVTVKAIKQNLDTLTKIEKEVTIALYESLNTSQVEPRLQKLVDAANNASDEGIELAITILKKFKK